MYRDWNGNFYLQLEIKPGRHGLGSQNNDNNAFHREKDIKK